MEAGRENVSRKEWLVENPIWSKTDILEANTLGRYILNLFLSLSFLRRGGSFACQSFFVATCNFPPVWLINAIMNKTKKIKQTNNTRKRQCAVERDITQI